MERMGQMLSGSEWKTLNCVILLQPYQTVSVEGLANRVVLVALHQNPLLHVLHEIQVLEGGHSLFSLFG